MYFWFIILSLNTHQALGVDKIHVGVDVNSVVGEDLLRRLEL